jgi:hypothetical protein
MPVQPFRRVTNLCNNLRFLPYDIPMELEDYDQLRQLVIDNGGVLTVEMKILRDIHGAGKLGVNVRANITKELKGRGLGHYPTDLPQYYWDPARLYLMGSPAGDLIEAVLMPSPDRDDLIRDTVNSDANEVLAKVRELVCA